MMNKERDRTTTQGNDNPQLLELQHYVNWIALSLLPVTGAYIYGAVMSGSVSAAALTLQCGISIFANIFTVISMRSIVNKNIFIFPYGTGKLENFIGFLTGTLMLPIAAMIYVSTVNSFMSGKHEVRFEFTQIGMIPGLLRSIYLLVWSKRLIAKSKSPSPIVQSFYVDYKVGVIVAIAGVLSMLLALWLTKMHYGHLGIMIDLALAAVLATYMLVNAVILIKTNFHSLIDLPLAESDQLKIMKVLTSHYDSFDNLGAIYTRTCGNTKIIEIELYFKRNTSIEEIDFLAERLSTDFDTLFADFNFRLIPKAGEDGHHGRP
ncbi:MAG: cation transporter [Deltaproteobacteria bacterium]